MISKNSWFYPKIYKMIKEKRDISEAEMFHTFNMGIGMTLVMEKNQAEQAKKFLRKKHKLKSWIIGEIVPGRRSVELI